MDKIRAEIVDTGIPLFFKTQLEIKAPPKVIFDLVADPKSHTKIDGSGMLKGELKAPKRLYLGASFGMKMRLGIPYIIKNTVLEFEENKSIAWRHLLHNVWRYELNKTDPRPTYENNKKTSYRQRLRSFSGRRKHTRNFHCDCP